MLHSILLLSATVSYVSENQAVSRIKMRVSAIAA